jgi:hypothetical protein
MQEDDRRTVAIYGIVDFDAVDWGVAGLRRGGQHGGSFFGLIGVLGMGGQRQEQSQPGGK